MRPSKIASRRRFVSIPLGQLLLAALLLLIVSGLAGWLAFQPHALAYPLPRITVAIALGPLGGWWDAWRTGNITGAFALLVSVTATGCLPLAAWIRWPRHSGLLGVATLLWFLAGYYFTVGRWI